MDVFCVGDINVDIITSPVALSRDIQVNADIFVSKGGEAFNFACAASKFGLKTGFAGKVGNDFFGRFLEEKGREFGVDSCLKKGKKTGVTLALTQKDRRFITDSGANETLEFRDVPKSHMEKSKAFFLGGFWHLKSLDCLKLLKFAKKNSLVFLNINSDPKGFTDKRVDYLMKCLQYVDVFFLNEAELKGIRKTPGELLEMVDMVCLHMGKKGARLYSKNRTFSCKGHAVEILNPTGAGDIFNAGFVYSVLRGKDFNYALEFGGTAAAMHIERLGDYMPSESAVRRRMRA